MTSRSILLRISDFRGLHVLFGAINDINSWHKPMDVPPVYEWTRATEYLVTGRMAGHIEWIVEVSLVPLLKDKLERTAEFVWKEANRRGSTAAFRDQGDFVWEFRPVPEDQVRSVTILYTELNSKSYTDLRRDGGRVERERVREEYFGSESVETILGDAILYDLTMDSRTQINSCDLSYVNQYIQDCQQLGLTPTLKARLRS